MNQGRFIKKIIREMNFGIHDTVVISNKQGGKVIKGL